ncbi:MAG: hypothetical protein U0X73_09555 [Thermoanaerobaculia bacterium]
MSVLRFAATALVAAWLAAPAVAIDFRDTYRRTFAFAAGVRPTLEIDNVFGDVRVRAGAAGEIRVTVEQTWSGRTEERLARARRDVTLEVEESAGELKLAMDGPFRCHDRLGRRRDSGHCVDWNDPGYEARFDFEVVVPPDVDLDLATVNDGVLEVSGTHGKFVFGNVNDRIRLADVAGDGRIATVNGPVDATFSAAPTRDLEVVTVNGDIDLAFPDDLAADLKYHTLNGDLYTDFELSRLRLPSTAERTVEGGRKRYRLAGGPSLRIGGGGIALSTTTVNGDIRVHRRES